mmetsp:Transcript_19704/g.41370  ORF Transcript_19704/g.41370 Transcript_19704/m.41370 type:complete len:224 (+) Transcript_19704:676-1347(+)
MNTVVSLVGDGGEAKFLVLLKNGLPDRTSGSSCRIGRSQQFSSELLPRQSILVPLNFVAMDTDTFSDKFASHNHEECIENIKRIFILRSNQSTIESTSKLDNLCLLPNLIQLFRSTTEFLAGLHGIGSASLLQDIRPFLPKSLLKFGLWYRNLIRRKNGGLRSNSVVVLIDQLLLVNGFSIDVGFRDNFNARGNEFVSNHFLSGRGVGVGFDEDEGRVLEGAG